MRALVVVGGGGHARVIIEAARVRPEHSVVLGFVDVDKCSETVRRLGIARLGDDTALAELSRRDDVDLILGVGGPPSLREAIVRRLGPRMRWAAVVHASAWVSPTVEIGPGAFVSAGAVVNTGALLARHAIVNSGAIVEHDVHIGSFAHVAPGVVIGGGASVGARVHLGLGARVRDHVVIGDDVVVGMAAAVVGNVPAGARVMGIPAKARGTA